MIQLLWHFTTVQKKQYSVKSSIILLLIFILINNIAAQKIEPVSKSPLTGIVLPAGSKQDKRMLMTVSANILLEDAAKKNNATVKNTEVLKTPLSFTLDSFTSALQQAGWKITPDQYNNKFYWLEQSGKYILACFYPAKKATDIYFAQSNQAPTAGAMQTPTQNDMQPQNNTVTAQPTGVAPIDTQVQIPEQQHNPTPATTSGFAFNTTNFDDGWTSSVKEDWVEVTKGNIKVLLHYPKEGTIFPADPEPMTNAAWNILVAPRYSNLKNYKTAYITTYKRPHLGMGNLTENSTGKEVFVLFFHQSDGWIEFVTPDKNSFVQQYKFDPETIRWDSEPDLMNPLANMNVYNKFAVGAADFTGKWTSDFTGIQQLYYVYTGTYAGMNINQSNEEFIFTNGGKYSWKLLVVNGMAGNAKFNQVKSSGKITILNNWQVHFTMIENKARTYHAFWSCIKGARVLNLLDAEYPGSGIYTKYGLAK